jgi:branched-chain amino acid transport system substrate-binding protein
MKKMLFRTTLLTAALSLGSVSGVLAAEKIVKIGGAIPLSGPAAYWGICTMEAWEDGAAEINAMGGVKVGDDTYKFEIINYDTKATVADARAATTRLIEKDEVKYIFNQTAASTIGMLQISEPNNVLSMAACWGYPEQFGEKFPLHFRAEMSDYEMGFAYIPFMLDKYGKENLQTAAFLGPDDKDGQDCHSSYQRLMDNYDIKQVGAEYFNWEDTDFYPIVTKILKTKPDFIVTSPSPPGITASIIKAAREMGYKGPIAAPAALETKTILEVAGEFADDVVLPVTNDIPQTETQKAVQERFTKRFGKFNALAGIYSWWPYALAEAFKAAGTVEDTAAVARALENVVLEDTYVGRVAFKGEKSFGLKRQAVYDCYTTVIEDGKAKLADVRYPDLPESY